MSEREPKRLPFLSIVSAAADCLREMPRTSKHLLHSGPTACCRFSPP